MLTPSPVSMKSLLEPRFCELDPTIARQNKKKPRWCRACRTLVPKPYACPLDAVRRALVEQAGGENG